MKKIIEALKQLRARSAVDLSDVFETSGIVFTSYGASQVYGPLGWIVLGVALYWIGVRRS